MKVVILIVFSIVLSITLGCQPSSAVNTDLTIEAIDNNNKKNQKNIVLINPTPEINNQATKTITEPLLLWHSTIDYEDLIDSEREPQLLSYDENEGDNSPDKKSPYYQARKGVQVDLMNCGGYLASGKLYSTKNSNFPSPNWRVKIDRDSVAKSAAEKIKKCNIMRFGDAPAEDEIISEFFAVIAHDKKRRTITIGDIDTKKLYEELANDMEWDRPQLPSKQALPENYDPELISTKKDLRSYEDVWTDLDGDGRIDLIKFQDSPCPEKYTCETVHQLINGKWKEIAYTFPQ